MTDFCLMLMCSFCVWQQHTHMHKCVQHNVQLLYERVCLHDLLTSARVFDLLSTVILWWMEKPLSQNPAVTLVWHGLGEAPSVWKDSLTSPSATSSASSPFFSFLTFPTPVNNSHSQKLHIAQSEGLGLGWGEGEEVGGGFGIKHIAGKVKSVAKGVSSMLENK